MIYERKIQGVNKLKTLAIIPARAGSKGLPNKNIKLLDGKPLIAYTIDAAIASKQFDEIMVSTDSKEYAAIALKCGAKVPFLRSNDSAGDTSSSWDVVKEVLSNYEKEGKTFQRVALLQPTSPLRTKDDIINGFNTMSEKNGNFVVSVCEVEHSPLWSNKLPPDVSLESFIDSKITMLPRQQIPIYYRLNGAFYLVDVDYLYSTDNLYKEKSYAVIMNKYNSVDIDDELDFQFAELLMKNKKNNKETSTKD